MIEPLYFDELTEDGRYLVLTFYINLSLAFDYCNVNR